MKTIIIKSTGNRSKLMKTISKLEKYIDHNINDACVRTILMDQDNYNTVVGELKDAVLLNDFDIFLIGVVPTEMSALDSLKSINRAHTFVCEDDEYDSAKNYVIML